MKRQELEVTLKFNVRLYTERELPLDLNLTAECLSDDHYNGDGRFPFFEEMMAHALNQLLQGASSNATLKQLQERYGQEMVEYMNGKGQRAYVEADALPKLDFWVEENFQATIEEKHEDSEDSQDQT